MTPWEVLGIAEGESDPEAVRRGYERRLERFGDIGEARSWIESAFNLLQEDPTGADPYGVLVDPWGKWDEILASRREAVADPPRTAPPPVESAAPVEPTAPEPEFEEPTKQLAADEEELPSPPKAADREPLSDYEMRFRTAANRTDPVARNNALRSAAHDLADAMARNPALIPLWARLVLTCCGRASGALPQVVRRQDLALDLAGAGGAVTDALIDDALRREDFRLLRFIAGAILREFARESSMDTARLAFRIAGHLALARPQTSRNLLIALHESGKLTRLLEADRRKLERRIRAGEEMNLWSAPARMAIAKAEAAGHWAGEATGAATQQALAGLRTLKELGGDKSHLISLVKERAPTLLHAALRGGERRETKQGRKERKRKKERLSTRWREAIRREEGRNADQTSRRHPSASSKPPIAQIIAVVVFLIVLLRWCG